MHVSSLRAVELKSGTYLVPITGHRRASPADSSPTLSLPAAFGSPITITRLTSPSWIAALSTAAPTEATFAISIHLDPCKTLDICDLELNPALDLKAPFDVVQMHVPRIALNRFTAVAGLPRVSTLECEDGTRDPILHHMALAILPALERPGLFSSLFLDQFRQMLCAHLVSRYATHPVATPRFSGGLAPWQKRRIAERISGPLGAERRLTTLAGECGLSVSHFARSFKRSFGTTVHRYLVAQQVERAKTLLLRSNQSLPQVALDSGFSDQSAFNRTFHAAVGTSPGRWRRERSIAASAKIGFPESLPASFSTQRSLHTQSRAS